MLTSGRKFPCIYEVSVYFSPLFSVFISANQARSVVGPFQTHQCHLLKRKKGQKMISVESFEGKRWLKPTTQLLQRKSFEAKIVSKFRVLDFWSPVHDLRCSVSYPSANFLPKRMFEKQVLPPELWFKCLILQSPVIGMKGEILSP